MTTSATTMTASVSCWKNDQVQVGHQVEVDPAAIGWNGNHASTDNRHGEVVHTYADGENVKIKSSDGATSKIACDQVRLVRSNIDRNAMKNDEMNTAHECLRRSLAKFVNGIVNGHRTLLDKIVEEGEEHGAREVAHRLSWDTEKLMKAGAAHKVLAQYHVLSAIEQYINGTLPLPELVKNIDEARDRAGKDALQSPYGHNCTSAPSNLYDEVEHQVRCELGSREGFGGSWASRLFYINREAEEIERTANAW